MEKLIPRLFRDIKQSYFLFGARGTGKTTFLKQKYSNALWIDLLDPENYRKYTAYPERLKEIIEANSDKRVIIIDEIQRIPELLNIIHILIEENKNKKFILTGSSSRKLKRSGIDLLSGRVIKKQLHPFLFSELNNKFSFNKILKYGLIPLVLMSQTIEDTLKSYIDLYIQEEIKIEGIVRNIGNFSRFLEAISFSHANILNITNISRECMVERKTVEGYITILEDLLIAHRLPVFSRKAKRKMSSHPKFYFFDTGVYRALRPKGSLDNPEEIDGASLEGLVFQNLLAWIDYRNKNEKLYFYRTKSGMEVDFIIYGSDIFYAIEVKNTKNINTKHLKNLILFGKDYKNAKLYFLYMGKEKIKIKNILCVPVEDFLNELKI